MRDEVARGIRTQRDLAGQNGALIRAREEIRELRARVAELEAEVASLRAMPSTSVMLLGGGA